jgi:hypothetical protein
MSEIAKALCDIAGAGATAGGFELHADLTDALAQTRTALAVLISRAAA